MSANPGGAYFENSNTDPLLEHRQGDEAERRQNFGCWYQIQRCMGWVASRENRTIYLSGRTRPSRFPSNQLDNQKYNLFTFLPLLLYNEFKFFFNLFFLLIALSQFVPFLKVGLLITYVSPLAFVLTVTMLKEAYDDFKRAQRDKELNNAKFEKLTEKGTISQITAREISVG